MNAVDLTMITAGSPGTTHTPMGAPRRSGGGREVMGSACPDLDLVREALKIVARIETLAAGPGASRDRALIIAAKGARQLVAPLEMLAAARAADECDAEMLATARRKGFREGIAHAEALAAARLAEAGERCPPLRLARA